MKTQKERAGWFLQLLTDSINQNKRVYQQVIHQYSGKMLDNSQDILAECIRAIKLARGKYRDAILELVTKSVISSPTAKNKMGVQYKNAQGDTTTPPTKQGVTPEEIKAGADALTALIGLFGHKDKNTYTPPQPQSPPPPQRSGMGAGTVLGIVVGLGVVGVLVAMAIKSGKKGK